MEQKFYNITINTRKANRDMKRKQRRAFRLSFLRILFTLFLTLILFGVLKAILTNEYKEANPAPPAVEMAKVSRGISFKEGRETITANLLIPPVPSKEETDSPELIEFVATAYCSCQKCCGYWATVRGDGPVVGAAGVPLVPGVSIAIDNSLYKFGTSFVDQEGHTYIAADTGSGIKGNRMDVYFSNHQQAREFGVQTVFLAMEEEV